MATYYDFNEEAYWEYKDEVLNSQGFHVLSEYGSQLMGGIFHVAEHSHAFQKAVTAAEFAVAEHNQKENANLKFLNVLNVNVEPSAGPVYYITLVAKESSGNVKHYHAKVWSKINSGYQVQIFKVAPYSVKDLGIEDDDSCCLRMENLLPWMDENYLYYKCFYKTKELVSIQVVRYKPQRQGHGFLRFKSASAAQKVLATYNGIPMPTANQVFKLEFVSTS